MPVSSVGGETTTNTTRAALIFVLTALPRMAAAAPAVECLGAWQANATLAALGNVAVTCTDGDPTCDRDGTADGTCRVAVSYCLNVGACGASGIVSPAITGAAGGAVATSLGALAYPVGGADVCSEPAEVAVTLGRARRRRATLRAQVRDVAGGRDTDRLRIVCRRQGGAGRALVVTTDFETGALATVGLAPPRRVGHPAAQVHSDAVVRVSGGMVFVLNRFLGDNVQRLDGKALRTRFQCSTGAGSNPHDIVVVAPDKAYVTRYDRTELWIVDPSVRGCERFKRGTIDLGRFADGDTLPEMSQMALVDGRLFVSVQRLDRRRGFAPTGPSRLVVIDVATDAIVGEIPLFGANAFGDSSGIVREPGSGMLVVGTPGDIYRVGDGGLERVDPVGLVAEGRYFADETALGGNVTDFVLLSPTKGYAVVQDAALKNHLVAFDPTGAAPPRDLYARAAFLPDVTVGPDGLLWLADQGLPDPGVRLFDPTTDRPVQRRPLRVGLPPFSIGFLP
jgi:hypothetical protein